MKCDRFREAASARLDGEPIGISAAALDDHLATCAQCARWLADATRMSRQLRLGSAEVPDLSDAIMADAVLPARRVQRRRRWLRIVLGLTGVAQIVIAAPSLAGDSLGMAMSAHGAHESAAWNLALGIAFLAAASRPRRAAGLVTVLGTFLGVLAVLTVRDVAHGVVAADRLATHLAAVVGLLLVLALDRAEKALPPEWPASAERPEPGETGLRGVA